MTETDALLSANATFYNAFARADASGMEALWAERAPISCLHPGWDVLLGREAVLGSWKAILRSGAPPIRATRAQAMVYGGVGLVVCHEHVGPATLAATNWFVIEDGRWKMVCHQAAPIARSVQVGDDDDDDADLEDDDDGTPPPEEGSGGMVN